MANTNRKDLDALRVKASQALDEIYLEREIQKRENGEREQLETTISTFDEQEPSNDLEKLHRRLRAETMVEKNIEEMCRLHEQAIKRENENEERRKQEWHNNEKKRINAISQKDTTDENFQNVKTVASIIYIVASCIACITNICLIDHFDQEWTGWAISALLLVAMIMFLISRSYAKSIKCMQDDRIKEKESEHQSVKSNISKLHNAMAEKYGNNYLYDISGAPEGDFIDENLLPRSSKNILTDRYTFFAGSSFPNAYAKYHKYGCRYAVRNVPYNAYDIKTKTYWEPCSLCNPKLPDTEWVDKYRSHYRFLTKYFYVSTKRYSEKLKVEDIREKLQEQSNQSQSKNPQQSPKEYIYVTAANGMEVRIPKDRYPQWKAAQDKIRAGEKPDVSETVKSLVSLMKGEETDPDNKKE